MISKNRMAILYPSTTYWIIFKYLRTFQFQHSRCQVCFAQKLHKTFVLKNGCFYMVGGGEDVHKEHVYTNIWPNNPLQGWFLPVCSGAHAAQGAKKKKNGISNIAHKDLSWADSVTHSFEPIEHKNHVYFNVQRMLYTHRREYGGYFSVQHSAHSLKSNSTGWFCYTLIRAGKHKNFNVGRVL